MRNKQACFDTGRVALIYLPGPQNAAYAYVEAAVNFASLPTDDTYDSGAGLVLRANPAGGIGNYSCVLGTRGANNPNISAANNSLSAPDSDSLYAGIFRYSWDGVNFPDQTAEAVVKLGPMSSYLNSAQKLGCEISPINGDDVVRLYFNDELKLS